MTTLNASLLEKLTLTFNGDVPIGTVNTQERYIYSVMNHIERLLNTRRGSIKHIPEYGLPDLSIIYQHLPGSLTLLQNHITSTLLKYEPRLESVQIRLLQSQSSDFILAYELLCQLKDIGYVRFSTTFDSAETVHVSRSR